MEQHPVTGLLLHAAREDDLALLGELHRVVDEVHQHLLKAQRIAAQALGDVLREGEQELEATLVGAMGDDAGEVVEDLVELEADVLHVELAGLDLREIQDVVDDPQERVRRALDLHQVVALLGREIGLEREVGEAHDRVHRGADLVAHVGEEVTLHAVRVVGRVASLLELCGALGDDLLELVAMALEGPVLGLDVVQQGLA